MAETEVILVDINDVQTGVMEKMEAHKKALLHRAISVFIFNDKGDWLMQQRTMDKYHSKGLWTNTCCSHPYPDEDTMEAARRRLMEEMGLRTELTEIFSFVYQQELENGLTEHEFDHVFIGVCNETPQPHPEEVMNFKYIPYRQLKKDIEQNPDKYTAWFKLIYERVEKELKR